MDTLLSIENLIKEVKKQGVDFGKGDPYNRLRYYTKIGWLPHMIRKKEEDKDSIKGHYPHWTISRLVYIEQLKKQGVSNEDIKKKINTKDTIQSFRTAVSSETTREKIVSYISLSVLLLILLNELEVINIGKQKSQLISQTGNVQETQMITSGVSFVPANQKKVFIKSNYVTAISKINVTFNQDFSPATRYWISDKKPLEGFYVELDSPVFNNSEFTWWLGN